ncbi:MAG: hypothetical protein CMN30_18500 [Sandaracinus sp.]|nr:hypothetical protein [Sandaracinus sp.]
MRSSGARIGAALVAVAVLLVADAAWAHAVGFGAWRLEAQGDGRWSSSLRVDGADEPLGLEVEGCTEEAADVERDAPTTWLRGVLHCPDGPGPRFALEGLPDHMRVHVTLVPETGPERTFVLRAESPSHTVGAARSPGWTYLRLGVEHILIGWDHVAFVLALLLLLRLDRRGWRRGLSTLSAFTVGHSLTLGLAAWGWVSVDPALTEAMIAASLVLLAVELARGVRGAEPGLSRRRPEAVALFFGLFHGLGFAGVLREIGLPPDDALLALLAFNGGVEVGQVLVAVLATGLFALLGRRRGWQLGAAYALGCAGVFVTLERVFG